MLDYSADAPPIEVYSDACRRMLACTGCTVLKQGSHQEKFVVRLYPIDGPHVLEAQSLADGLRRLDPLQCAAEVIAYCDLVSLIQHVSNRFTAVDFNGRPYTRPKKMGRSRHYRDAVEDLCTTAAAFPRITFKLVHRGASLYRRCHAIAGAVSKGAHRHRLAGKPGTPIWDPRADVILQEAG